MPARKKPVPAARQPPGRCTGSTGHDWGDYYYKSYTHTHHECVNCGQWKITPNHRPPRDYDGRDAATAYKSRRRRKGRINEVQGNSKTTDGDAEVGGLLGMGSDLRAGSNTGRDRMKLQFNLDLTKLRRPERPPPKKRERAPGPKRIGVPAIPGLTPERDAPYEPMTEAHYQELKIQVAREFNVDASSTYICEVTRDELNEIIMGLALLTRLRKGEVPPLQKIANRPVERLAGRSDALCKKLMEELNG